MNNINKVNAMINREIMITNIFMGMTMFIGLTMIVVGVIYTIVLVVMGMIFITWVTLALAPRRETRKYVKELKKHVTLDIVKAVAVLDSEIGFIQDTLNAPKHEMDVHSLNATNEGKAMIASLRNELALRKKLGRFILMRDLLNEHLIGLKKSKATPWDK